MSHSGRREPTASLSLLDATMVGIGAMIGAGIFVLTGLAVDISGPAAIVAFALNGGVTTFTALSYAELAAAIPRNGGGYAYVREVFSAPVSFVMGWTRWFTYMIAGSLYALGFASNFIEWGHLYGIELPGPAVGYALFAVAALVTLNALSTEASGKGETVITLVKIAILGVFVAFGLTAARTGEFRPLFSKGALSVLPAMGLTFIAFQGYDLIATVTEEVENPRVNIPRAIILSVVVTVIVYLLVVFVAIGTLGAEALGGAGETAIAQAAEGFMPRFPVIGTGASLIAFGAVFSTISALNAVVIGSSRVAFAMGREGQLPARLGRFHHRYGTPLAAIAASAVLMLVAVVVVPIRVVGNLASLFSLLGFVVVNLALIRLRSQQPDLQRPFEVPFYPVTPILGIVCNLLLGLFIDPFTWALALGWLAFGGVVYLVWSRRRERPRDEAEAAEIQAPEPIASAEEGDD
ncbi:amino acid transporter [Salinigranum rubrum]|uniref:Amino acid transporter n=1 Tax=Salinigranum rubrum TaxID=755307 RepID=A0A2I8VHH7_9EURY|nr:APC family permease [Salinigranum rubrum]AUV81392.1 amino acid transporter [Salinigranum rubrum]